MDSWARFALDLGGGVGGSSESGVNSLTVSSVELDVEGLHLERSWSIRFIPAKIQVRWKRTAGPGPVLALSVSFEMIGLVMRKINSTTIWLCWPSGNCWVPVRDEFNSRLELKILCDTFEFGYQAQISDEQLPVPCAGSYFSHPNLRFCEHCKISSSAIFLQAQGSNAAFDWHFGSHRRARGSRRAQLRELQMAYVLELQWFFNFG